MYTWNVNETFKTSTFSGKKKRYSFVALQTWKLKKAVFTDRNFVATFCRKSIIITIFSWGILPQKCISHSCISTMQCTRFLSPDKQEVKMDVGNLIERDLEATLMPLTVTSDWLEDDNETIRNQFQQPDWQVGGVSMKERGWNDWMN